ncbi:glycosyl hydrolase 108 family protein [Brucella sp. TWI432]
MSAQSTSLSFERCHAVTSHWEGGWSDHKSDPGGKTMYGITEKVWIAWNKAKGILKPKPVRQITRSEAEEIYFKNYWLASGCDKLKPGVDLCTYDSSVNSGVSRARSWLKASIGGSDLETVRKMCAKRLSFLRALKNFAVFGKGWVNRVTDVEAKATKLVLENEGAGKNTVSITLKTGAQTATKNAAKADTRVKISGGATTVAGGGTYVAPDTVPVDAVTSNADIISTWLLGGVITVGLVVVAYFLIRSMIEKSRAKSFEGVAA